MKNLTLSVLTFVIACAAMAMVCQGLLGVTPAPTAGVTVQLKD